MHERENLCDVDICEGMHDRVEKIVNKDHSNDSTRCLLILCFGVVGTSSCPTRKDGSHADEGNEVLRSPAELLCEECGCHTCDKVPAGQPKVDLILLSSVHNADCG